MSNFVYLSDRIMPAGDGRISAVSAAALYGRGVFTTAAIIDGEPFLWEKHWRRLTLHAAKLGVSIGEYAEHRVLSALVELVEANEVQNGRARITFLDNAPGTAWPLTDGREANLLITAAGRRELPDGLRLTVSPFAANSVSPLSGIKSCNYLEKTIALAEGCQRGADEAIQLNERGEIVSACMSNIFWITGGTVCTPSLRTGCLAGTTREFVMEKIKCEEVEEPIDALSSAEGVFLTSAGLGIIRALQIDERTFSVTDAPITRLLPSFSR